MDVCWESNTAGYKESRRLLKCREATFLVQILNKPARSEVVLDLVLTSVEELIKRS